MAQAQAQAEAQLETRAYQEAIPPFWGKLPSFFAYPFQFAPLVVIGALTLASVFSAFIGGLFKGLLAYLFLRYAFSVMEQSARGDFNSDSPDISTWGGADRRPAKQTIVFLFYAAVLFGLATVAAVPVAKPAAEAALAQPVVQAPAGVDPTAPRPQPTVEEDEEEGEGSVAAAPDRVPTSYAEAMAMSAAAEPEPAPSEEYRQPAWFYLLAVLAAIPLPGAIMVIALEDNLVRALNPMTTFFFIRAMGKAYFVLWFFFALILGARELVLRLAAEASVFVRLPLEMALGGYLMLVLFATMGYALYQYHQELGYDVKVDFDTHREKEVRAASAAAGKPVDPIAQQVNALVKEGRMDEALRVVHDAMRYDKLNADLNERAHQLYVAKGDPAKTLAHGVAYVHSLVAAKRGSKALAALGKLRALDAKFEPNADSLLGLAQAAMAVRDTATAVELVKGFDKRFPGHADTPAVYLLGAKITSEHLHQDEKAMRILQALLQRYPDAAVKEEAQKYLAVLARVARLAASPAAPAARGATSTTPA